MQRLRNPRLGCFACARAKQVWALRFCASEPRRRMPVGHWAERSNRRAFLDQMAAKHGIEKAADWKRVTYRDIVEAGGGSMLNRHFSGSVYAALADAYPEQQLLEPECRSSVPRGYWDETKNQRNFLEKLKARMEAESGRGWEAVRHRDVVLAGGSALLRRHNDSVKQLLEAVYPEEDFTGLTARNQWQEKEERRRFFDGVAEKLGIQEASQWKKVTTRDVLALGGSQVLSYYPSLLAGLQDVYAEGRREHPWTAVNCRPYVADEDMRDEANVVALVRQVEEKLGIAREEEWYRVSQRQVEGVTGGSRLLKSVGLGRALEIAYPDACWDPNALASKGGKRAAQRHLRLLLADLIAKPLAAYA